MAFTEVVYWLSLFVLVWVFVGYPLIVIALGNIKRQDKVAGVARTESAMVTVLICAYNEERVIGEKINNTLSLEYPADRLNIIVVSDGSSDRTNDICRSFHDTRLTFLDYPDRGGKAKALNTGIAKITSEFVIFTDANVFFKPDAVSKLLARFDSPQIGGVVGNVILRSPDGTIAGEGIYSRYEKAVHAAEAELATMITVDGAMYALRRPHVRQIPPDSIADDWFLASGVLMDHRKIAWAPDAIGYEDAAESVAGEFQRKVRMVAGGYQTTLRRASLFLNPICRPVITAMFVSHKLLRWLATIFMASFLVANSLLVSGSTYYQVTLWGQAVFYLLALLGWVLRRQTSATPVYIPYYFMAVNWGALMGLWRYLARSQKAAWTKSRA